MPTYEYACPSCGAEVELRVPMDERDDQRCPTCGAVLHRAISPLGAVWVKK